MIDIAKRELSPGDLAALSVRAIAPDGGGGFHVFHPEARDGLATWGIVGIGARVWTLQATRQNPRPIWTGTDVVFERGVWAGPKLSQWLREAPPELFLFDHNRPQAYRFDQCCEWLSGQAPGIDLLTIDCHGWMLGLQMGANIGKVVRGRQLVPRNIERFADVLAKVLKPNARIQLNACTAADGPFDTAAKGLRDGAPGGDGGFMDTLRDELCMRGLVWVELTGHGDKGHARRNPILRRAVGGGDRLGGTGGYYVCTKGPRFKRFVRYLTAEGPGAPRHRVIMLTDEQVHAELDAMAA